MHNAKWMVLAIAMTSIIISGPAVSRTISYTYNSSGQITSIDGPRIDVPDITTYTYDTHDNLTAITNALGHLTLFSAYNSHGQPLSITDPNGVITTFEYDTRQRLIRRTAGERTTRFSYDPVGNLIRITYPDGSYLEHLYDAARRIVGVADNLDNRVNYTLDAAGNRLSEEVFDPQGNLALLRRQSFDSLSRMRTRLGADGGVTHFSYDPAGNLLTQVDPRQRQTSHAYGAFNRLVETLGPAGGRTGYSYDDQDRLTEVVDPRGVTTIYSYNAFGDLLEETSQDAGTRTFTVNEAGILATETDARGITRTFSYDALNRITDIRYPDDAEDVLFIYDQGPYGIGRLSAIEDSSGRIEYVYNAHGEVLTETRHAGDLRFETRYDYDSHGRIAAVHYPRGTTLQFDYDSGGRIVGITLYHDSTIVRLAEDISHATFGAVTGLRLGNGVRLQRDYDLDGRLSIARFEGALELDLAYDPAGNITALTDLLNAKRSQAFDYDALDHLVSALGAYGYRDYTYDSVGNRLTRESGTLTEDYTYATDSNRLTSVSGGPLPRQYLYDTNGNILNDGRFAYTYNQANRLTRVSRLGSEQAQYTHNALGQRTRKTLPGSRSRAAQRSEADEHIAFHEMEAERLSTLAARYLAENDDSTSQARVLEALAEADRKAMRQARVEAGARIALAESHEALADVLDGFIAQLDVMRIAEPSSTIQRLFNLSLDITIAEFKRRVTQLRAQAFEFRTAATVLQVEADNALALALTKEQQAAAWLTEATRLRAEAQTHQRQATHHAEQAALWAQRLTELDNDSLTPAGQDTHFVYDLTGQLIGEYDHDGNSVREYIYLEGIPLAMVHEGAIFYYHTDHLGTPSRMTDQSQQVVWDAIQSPFGNLTLLTEVIENPLRFSGQYHDSETGLNYNYFRTYDPLMGRYTQYDPIGLNGGLNTYGYVLANPLRYTDFFGLAVECKWVVTDYYDKVTPVLVKPEVLHMNQVCYPVPSPSVGIPDPTNPRKRPGFPSPFDISFQMECVRKWVVAQEAQWDFSVERWMKGYMQCSDTCTGEVTNHWSPDRRVTDPPMIH